MSIFGPKKDIDTSELEQEIKKMEKEIKVMNIKNDLLYNKIQDIKKIRERDSSNE